MPALAEWQAAERRRSCVRQGGSGEGGGGRGGGGRGGEGAGGRLQRWRTHTFPTRIEGASASDEVYGSYRPSLQPQSSPIPAQDVTKCKRCSVAKGKQVN
jgi:hypothetical protein